MEDLALDDDDLGGAEEKAPIVPAGTKRLRACLVSKLIKTEQQFVDEGCENVPELPMRGERETVLECTTTDFDGMVALMDPAKSWVGKWQGISARTAHAGGTRRAGTGAGAGRARRAAHPQPLHRPLTHHPAPPRRPPAPRVLRAHRARRAARRVRGTLGGCRYQLRARPGVRGRARGLQRGPGVVCAWAPGCRLEGPRGATERAWGQCGSPSAHFHPGVVRTPHRAPPPLWSQSRVVRLAGRRQRGTGAAGPGHRRDRRQLVMPLGHLESRPSHPGSRPALAPWWGRRCRPVGPRCGPTSCASSGIPVRRAQDGGSGATEAAARPHLALGFQTVGTTGDG